MVKIFIKYMEKPKNHDGKPLRIAILLDDFYPNSGGVARSVELQISQLMELGHDVTLFAPKPFFVPPRCNYKIMPVWRIPGTPSFLSSLRFSDKLVNSIIRKYKHFDIIHSQNERGSMFLAAKLAKKMKVPHVHTFHSNYAGTHKTAKVLAFLNTVTYMKFAPVVMRMIRLDRDRLKIRPPTYLPEQEKGWAAKQDWKSVAKLAQYTDAFTSPAEYVISNINSSSDNKLLGKGHVVPNGIANDIFFKAVRLRKNDGKIRFISTSRLDPEKRVGTLIKAFARLNNEDAELFILDNGTERKNLEKLAREKVKHGRVLFLGHYGQRERVANELVNSDVFLFGSYGFDTQGMVLAEAASCGLPIIYCDNRLTVGVSPLNAILSRPSASAFAEAMRDLMNDPGRRQAMGQASKQLAKNLTPEAMEKKFVSVYRQAINDLRFSVNKQ